VHVVLQSFNANRSMVGWGGFTTEWYTRIWSNETVLEGASNSLIIAVLVTFPGGCAGDQHRRRQPEATGKGPFPARCPDLCPHHHARAGAGHCAVDLYERDPHPTRDSRDGDCHTVWSSAYVTVIVNARLAGRDQSLDEAARDLGATRWRAFWRVTLPDLMPAVAASALLVFAYSFEDVVTSYFLSGDKNTLPTVILSLIRYEVNPGVNAIGQRRSSA